MPQAGRVQLRVARIVLATAAGAWALVALGFGGLLTAEFLLKTDLSCPAPHRSTDSDFGTAYLSVVPPGIGCAYDASQVPPDGAQDAPPGARTAVLAGLGASGLGVLAGRRAFHRRFPGERRPPRHRFQDLLVRAE